MHRVRLPAGVDGWLRTSGEAARTALTHPHVVKGGGRQGGGPFQAILPPDLTAAAYRHMLSADPPDHTRLDGGADHAPPELISSAAGGQAHPAQPSRHHPIGPRASS